MDLSVAGMVLLAALLHAGWNGVVKGRGGDPLVMLTLVTVASSVLAALTLPVVAVPLPAAWPYIAASVVLHTGYGLFLLNAYRHGALGKVYPIARGTAPVIVAVVSIAFLGERVAPLVLAGSLVISAGVMSLALVRAEDGDDGHRRALIFAFGTAVFIAAYTIVDGLGARAAGSPHGYAAWLFVLDGIPMLAITAIKRGRSALPLVRQQWRAGLAGGLMSLAAYWLVIWAMTLGAMAPVAALRETSVIFAALLSAFVLKEGFGALRMVSATAVTAGVVLMRL